MSAEETSIKASGSITFSERGEKQVFAWILGRLNRFEKITTMLFGQFTTTVIPPDSGWVYCGKNISANFITFTKVEPYNFESSIDDSSTAFPEANVSKLLEIDSSLIEITPRAAEDVPRGFEESFHPGSSVSYSSYPMSVDEEVMSAVKDDDIRVDEAEGIDMKKYLDGEYVIEHRDIFSVSGCSHKDVNGRYLEWGTSAGVLRYKNTKGWVLFRVALSEIPEMGIRADNCYEALDGEPVINIMERKAAKAYEDLLDMKNEIKEGSNSFKEKFTEISRLGMRLINYDQTYQVLRNNDLRAYVRTKAGRAMLLQLLALKSNEAKGENTAHEAEVGDMLLDTPQVEKRDEADDATVATSSSIRSEQEQVDEINIDIETTFAKKAMYQRGLQGFLISDDEEFLRKEAELARDVMNIIEHRERLLFDLSVEAQRIHRDFIESHEVDIHNNNFEVILPLLRHMDGVREATISFSEALGAWIRLCRNEKKRKTAFKSSSVFREPRKYCVAIAVRGQELYPASEAVTAGVRRFRRGREELKRSIDVSYVGIFDKKQEAVDAFVLAASRVPLEKRAFPYADSPPMYIGLRECRNHYLVRSDGVSSDLPCEECAAKEYGKPCDIVNASEKEILPQFLWHDQNYLEKIWIDTNFLKESAPLLKYYPSFDVDGNPLLLDRESYFQGLQAIGICNSSPFDKLLGKSEQLEEAQKIANFKKPKPSKYNFMGTPYLENFLKKLNAKYGVIDSIKHPVENKSDYVKINSTLQTDLRPLYLTAKLDVRKGLAFTDDEHDSIRLQRALAVLCQTGGVYIDILPKHSRTDRLNMTALQREPLKRPTLPSEMKRKIAEGLTFKSAVSENYGKSDQSDQQMLITDKYPDSGIVGKFVPTETTYEYLGAKLKTVQMRPQVANRVEETWCRTDVGEWKGLTKGRNMRSFEFQERLLKISKFLISERLRLQKAIRKMLEIHYADARPPEIRALIIEAQGIRGTALKLDIAQAELYLQRWKTIFDIITRVKARYLGFRARRRVKRMKDDTFRAKEYKRITEEISYDVAREFVIPLINNCRERISKSYNKMMSNCCLNISGNCYVVSIYALPRKPIRNEAVVCESCATKSTVKVYNPKLHTYFNQRAICTCPLVQEREKVLFKLYDPITLQSFYKILTESQIRENIIFAENIGKISLQEMRSKLLGDSFGSLTPLFMLPGELSSSKKCTLSEVATARMEAARESSILPLFPKIIPVALRQAARLSTAVSIESVRKFYEIESTRGPITVIDIHANDAIIELKHNTHWEIFTNNRYAARQADRVQHEVEVLEKRADNSEAAYTAASEEEQRRRNYLDCVLMCFEDIRVQIITTNQDLIDAKARIKRVCLYSKEGLEKFSAEESNIKEDWSQSHESMENGNAWININQQRRLESKMKSQLLVYIERFYKIDEARDALAKSIEDMDKAREVSIYDRASAIVYKPNLALIRNMQYTLEKSIKGLPRLSLCRYYIPYTPLCKKRRKVLRDAHLEAVYIRDPMTRSNPKYRYLWHVMEKKVIGVKVIASAYEAGSVTRVVATYLVDPVTNFHILNLMSEDKIIFEESIMHEDFLVKKEEFSEALSTGVDSEILLSPENVSDFLLRDLNKPQVVVRRRQSKLPLPEGIKKIRPLNVRISPNAEDRLAALPRGYSARRRKVDNKLYDDANTILSSLRLQPYSRRPCLGRLYFDRRLRYVTPLILSSMWFNGVRNMESVQWINEFHENLFFLAGTIVKVIIRNNWDKFEFNIILPGELCFLYSLSFSDILNSFSKKPFLLSSFLVEILTNSFSDDSINHIISHIDVTYPGEGVSFWRKRMRDNIPVINFRTNEDERFRGPIFCIHRFMSGFYLAVDIYKTVRDDFRIVLKQPTDGNYWLSAYEGENVVVDISREEIIAWLHTRFRSYQGGVFLLESLLQLHSYNWEILFSFLLDSMEVQIPLKSEQLSDNIAELSFKKLYLDHVLKGESGNRLMYDKNYVYARIRLLLRKFNKWVKARTKGKVSTIPANLIQKIQEKIQSIGHTESSYTFSTNGQIEQRLRLIEVFRGVWSTPAPLHCRKYLQKNTWSDSPLLNMFIFCRNDMSHLVFNMYTDISKEKLFVKISSGSLNEKSVQQIEADIETPLMSAEENFMRNYETSVKLDDFQKKREQFVKENMILFQKYSLCYQEKLSFKENLETVILGELDQLYETTNLYVEANRISSYGLVHRRLKSMECYFSSFSSNDILYKDFSDMVYDFVDSAVEESLKSAPKLTPNLDRFRFGHYPAEVSIFIESVRKVRSEVISKRVRGDVAVLSLDQSEVLPSYVKRTSIGRINQFRCTATAGNEDLAKERHITHTKGSVVQSYRSYRSWTGVNMIFDGQKCFHPEVFRNDSKFYTLYEPKFGPFDIFSLKIYDVQNNLFVRRLFIPPFSTEDSFSSTKENITIERACAVRLVSFGIITATASVAAKFIFKKLDSELIELEETVTKAWSNTNLNIENEDYRSFCRRFDDERVVVKRPIPLRNLPKAGITYGVYVPLDEEKFPILFQCDSYDWKECCRPYFEKGAILNPRMKTLPMYIYTQNDRNDSSIPLNDRVIDWNRRFIDSCGWRSDEKEIQRLNLRKVLDKKFEESIFENNEEYRISGDVVVFMRFGKRDADSFVEYCSKRYAETQPERDRLRELERTRKQRCRENHQKFRSHIFEFSEMFLGPFEEFCALGYRKVPVTSMSATSSKITQYYARLLVTQVLKYLDDPKYKALLDDAFLMDLDIGVEIEGNEDRFENYNPPLVQDVDPRNIFSREDNLRHNLEINPVQVLYVVIILHCTRCSLLPGSCTFLCCSKYKTNRCFEIPSEYGSGRHIVEKTARSYLLNMAENELKSKFLKTVQRPESGPDPDESDEEDRIAEEQAEEARIEKGVGETKWKKLKTEAAEYRFLNRRIARQEIEKITSKEAYLASQPGDYPLDENEKLSIERKAALEDALADMKDDNSASLIKTAVEDYTVDKEGYTKLFYFPWSVLRYLTGKSPDFLFGITSADMDPYPTNLSSNVVVESEVYPMRSNLFKWIMNRLSIQQTLSLDSNVVLGDVNFDRLLEQRVLEVDGVLIIVQVLFGILSGSLLTTPVDGYPISAKRYHDAKLLEEFEYGLTISVYDTLSDFSRALQFEKNTLAIWAEQFGLRDVEIPAVASEVIRRAHEIISIYRAGKIFSAFSVEPKKVLKETTSGECQKRHNLGPRNTGRGIRRRQRPSINFSAFRMLHLIRENEIGEE